MKENTTYEVCPFCETEVELNAELMVQTCPHCGKRIVACSMCLACDTEDNYCTHCCLDYQARTENAMAQEDAEIMARTARHAKQYKVPFLRHQWCDVVVKATSPEEAVKKAQAIFSEGHDGYVDWEDVDTPELDKYQWETRNNVK